MGTSISRQDTIDAIGLSVLINVCDHHNLTFRFWRKFDLPLIKALYPFDANGPPLKTPRIAVVSMIVVASEYF